ncbi:hypothetical protein [Stieleria varia]|uniref:Uncharacterized protein n=1 Tax=Stieleria varia TaxID=2528005 RepID=A0A5C6ATP3_9BACT|nr:hypothetical protein [Stieleria varia]TWU02436.1 hypothetical protein Pla52n_34860 [Stieleria varia]
MRTSIKVGIVAFSVVMHAGCSSSRSTMLARNECNTGWNKIGHLHGTPITLRVPTHLRVYVYQTHYMEQIDVAGIKRWQKVDMPPIYDFGSETLYNDKIFTTDFIRPAAGAFNLDVNYTEDQYIERVQQDITDETLKEIGNLVSKIPALFAAPGGAALAGGDNGAETLKEVKSVLAANVFEIDDPNFEVNVSEFVERHLNCRGPHCAPTGCPTDQVIQADSSDVGTIEPYVDFSTLNP